MTLQANENSQLPPIVAFLLSAEFSADGVASHTCEGASKQAGMGVRKRVLVVDDEDLIADSLAEILNRNGFVATAKYSGKAAIQHIEEVCPDIVVSDVVMPDCNGVQLAKSIQMHCPGTRIVLFSGNAVTPNLIDRASDDGYFFELLPKPIHPVQLLKALRA